jgi:hypothetical protein
LRGVASSFIIMGRSLRGTS